MRNPVGTPRRFREATPDRTAGAVCRATTRAGAGFAKPLQIVPLALSAEPPPTPARVSRKRRALSRKRAPDGRGFPAFSRKPQAWCAGCNGFAKTQPRSTALCFRETTRVVGQGFAKTQQWSTVYRFRENTQECTSGFAKTWRARPWRFRENSRERAAPFSRKPASGTGWGGRALGRPYCRTDARRSRGPGHFSDPLTRRWANCTSRLVQ
jgi:hypothetical protein